MKLKKIIKKANKLQQRIDKTVNDYNNELEFNPIKNVGVKVQNLCDIALKLPPAEIKLIIPSLEHLSLSLQQLSAICDNEDDKNDS